MEIESEEKRLKHIEEVLEEREITLTAQEKAQQA